MDDSIIARQVLVAEGDPKCAISYWGLYHQLWNRPDTVDLKRGGARTCSKEPHAIGA